MTRITLALNAASTFMMMGIVWFAQVVHYPLLDEVGFEALPSYQRLNIQLTTSLAGPIMAMEAGTALILAWKRPAAVSRSAAMTGLALVAVIWISTAILQLPQHEALAGGFDPAAHAALVGSNWIRTIAWSLRGALVVWMILKVITPNGAPHSPTSLDAVKPPDV